MELWVVSTLPSDSACICKWLADVWKNATITHDLVYGYLLVLPHSDFLTRIRCVSCQTWHGTHGAITFLISWLINFGDFKRILIDRFINLNVQTFQSLIVSYRRGNFVYYHCGCTSIYRPVSYPLRSMLKWIKSIKLSRPINFEQLKRKQEKEK